jgi:hypothetical protein
MEKLSSPRFDNWMNWNFDITCKIRRPNFCTEQLSIKGVPLMEKHDFVFFESEYLKEYTLLNPIVKYNVIFERKSCILNSGTTAVKKGSAARQALQCLML